MRNIKYILFFIIIITAISIYFASKLRINMKFMDLLPKSDQSVQEYKKAMKNFEALDSIVVGVSGKKENIENFIKITAEEIKKIEEVKNVRYKLEIEFIKRNFLLLSKENDLKDSIAFFTALNIGEIILGINDRFEKTYISNQDTGKLVKDRQKLLVYIKIIEDFLKDIDQSKLSNKTAEKLLIGEEYFISDKNDFGIYIINSKLGIDQIYEVVELVNKIESYLKKEAKKYNVDVAITGSQVITRDEMVVSEKDMTKTTLLSLILICIIFYMGFRRIRYLVIAIIPLCIGIIWSLAITYLIYGSLNIMTVMIGAILIGLGIDYAIHIISIFVNDLNMNEKYETIKLIYKKVAKGIFIGATTTATGFFMFVFSEFPGFSQFGIVLGIGIICTLVSSLVITPILILIFGKHEKYNERSNKIADILEKLIVKKSKLIVIMMIFIVVILGMNAKKIKIDNDMMNIEAKSLESVELNRKIIEKFDFSSDNSIIIDKNTEESQKNYDKLNDLDTVGEIDSIAHYIPKLVDQQNRLKLIKTILNERKLKKSKNYNNTDFVYELNRLEANIIELSDLAYMSGEKKLQEKCDKIIDIQIIENLIKKIKQNKLDYKKNEEEFMKYFANLIENANSEDIINMDVLPLSILERYKGKNNSFITIVYPKGDIWDSDFQKNHFQELEMLMKKITGTAKIFIKVVEAEIKEGKRVLILSTIAIFIILIIDFRSIKYAVLAIIPMMFSILITLGILVCLGIKLNVVSIIGLPLIIGIGVDDGVHIIHRYIQEKSIKIVLKTTGKAILMTTLTTIAAFGTMMIAQYRGFSTFGFLLVIGVGSAYILTILLLLPLIYIFDLDKETYN